MMSSVSEAINIVKRSEWDAQPPRQIQPIESLPVPFVIIHHSYTPQVCLTPDKCAAAMRGMQQFHQNDRGWNDIGYT